MTNLIDDDGDENRDRPRQEDGEEVTRRARELRRLVSSDDERSHAALGQRMQEFVLLLHVLLSNQPACEFLFKVMNHEDPALKIKPTKVLQGLAKIVFGRNVSRTGEVSWTRASDRASVAQELMLRKVPPERIARYMEERATYTDLLASWRRRGGSRNRQDQGALGFTSDGTQVVVQWDDELEVDLSDDGASEPVVVTGVVELAEDGSRRVRISRTRAAPTDAAPPQEDPGDPVSEDETSAAPADPKPHTDPTELDLPDADPFFVDHPELWEELRQQEFKLISCSNVIRDARRNNGRSVIADLHVEEDEAGRAVVYLHSLRQYPTPNWIKPIMAMRARKQGRCPIID